MEQPFLQQVKTLLQVGDTQYLDKVLQSNKIKSQAQVGTLIQKLSKGQDYNIAHQICKNGQIEMAKYFSTKASPKDFSLSFVDQAGQNCLHYAVSRNHQSFVDFLLNNQDIKKQHPLDINQQTKDAKETPLFFALNKIKKSKTDRVKMVKLLLEQEGINPGATNRDNKTAYEAYADQFGYDEAANQVEKHYLQGDQPESSVTDKSITFFKDFDQKQRGILKDKKLTNQEKAKLIEQHVYKYTKELNPKQELRVQVAMSQQIQERLKQLQNTTLYDPYPFVEREHLRRELEKKLMEFAGMTLIQNIKNLTE